MTIPIIDDTQFFEKLKKQTNPFFEDYYAFYSSWLGGITLNPHLMLLPIDDHMVHRGDGVFEAMKSEERGVYMMDEHLLRLFSSAEKIALKPLFNLETLKSIIIDTLKVVNKSSVMIRVFISRGPGNFSTNPYDSVSAQVYVAITRFKPLADEKYTHGVVIGKSHVPVKSSWMAQVKSCNYLPNVLMKKEAVDRGLDFVVAINEQGHITEGSTENIMIVSKDGSLVHPNFDHILKGTTLVRSCEIAKEHGVTIEERTISIEDLLSAREVMMTGTTLNILPVVEFEGNKIGDGKPGPITQKLLEWILMDIKDGPRRTMY